MRTTTSLASRLKALEEKHKPQKHGTTIAVTEEASLLLDAYMNTHTIPNEIYYKAVGGALVFNAKPSMPLLLDAERANRAIEEMEADIERLECGA